MNVRRISFLFYWVIQLGMIQCGLDDQVLVRYIQNETEKEITRKTFRDIIFWYDLEESMMNIVAQKKLIKQIALTEILAYEAQKAKTDISKLYSKYKDIYQRRALSRLLAAKWRKQEEEKPEKLYQTESIVLRANPGEPADDKKAFKIIQEIRNKLVHKKLSLAEVVSEVKTEVQNEGYTAKYFDSAYLPLNSMEETYRDEVLKLKQASYEESISQPFEASYGWQLVCLKDIVYAKKDEFPDYFSSKELKQSNLKAANRIDKLYWTRTLQFRNLEWRKKLYSKVLLEKDKPPRLPANWKNTSVLFQNKKIKISKDEFLRFKEMMSQNHKQTSSFSDKPDAETLFQSFLELIIVSRQATEEKLDQTDDFLRLKEWEKANILSREYINQHWFNSNVSKKNTGIQRNKNYENSWKQKEKMLLQKYKFQIMDVNFKENLI